MFKGRKSLSPAQRDRLAKVLLEKYRHDPVGLARAVPELAALLAGLVQQLPSPGEPFFDLTGKEQKERQNAYKEILSKMGRKRSMISREEAIKALEHAAVLQGGPLEAALVLEASALFKLVKLATGLSLEKRGPVRRAAIAEGEPTRTVSLVRGVTAYLGWDKRLLSIEVDPRGLAERAKALNFVGLGRDVKPDVALHHDEYAYGEANG